MVGVAPYGGQWGYGPQHEEDVVVSDVSGVDDVIDLGEGLEDDIEQRTVGIRYDADETQRPSAFLRLETRRLDTGTCVASLSVSDGTPYSAAIACTSFSA